jgi:hypothetical protein
MSSLKFGDFSFYFPNQILTDPYKAVSTAIIPNSAVENFSPKKEWQ